MWSEDQFWSASPKALFLAIEGFYDLQERKEKESWIRAQFTAYYSIFPHYKKADREKLKKAIFFFKPEQKPSKPLSKEERIATFSKIDQFYKEQYKAKKH